MAEYGRPAEDTGTHRAVLLAGAATAIGLVAFARRGHWQELLHNQLGTELDATKKTLAERAANAQTHLDELQALKTSRDWHKGFATQELFDNAVKEAERSVNRLNMQHASFEKFSAHIRTIDVPALGTLQSLGLEVARSAPMAWLKKGAKFLKPLQLLDELGGFRLLREVYSENVSQVQMLGPIERLAPFISHTLPKGLSPGDEAFFAHGRLFAKTEDLGYVQITGRYSMFGRASKGMPKSFQEKAVDDLSGKSANWREVRYYRRSLEERLKQLPSIGLTKEQDNSRKWLLGEIPRLRAREYDLVQSARKGASRGMAERFRSRLDLGYNVRGWLPWQREHWKDAFENIFHEFNPAEDLMGDRELERYDIIKQMPLSPKGVWEALVGGRFWGKRRDFNSGTMLVHHFFKRVNESTSHGGLTGWIALSGKSSGSPAELVYNMMVRRALPLYAGAFYAGYLNDQFREHTGHSLSERREMAEERAQLTWAGYKDRHGITAHVRHLDELSGGTLGYIVHPFVDHRVGMSQAELREYYAHGFDPIRKGRWWSFGSSTPFRGERIQYFNPAGAQYARAGNIYQTSTLWGSADEYYANAALPTPTHPFAPLQHFVLDRYHYERKHYHDRPYLLTSPLFEPTTVHGALLNPTLGRILKPQHLMHASELPYYISGPKTGRPNPRYRGDRRSLQEQTRQLAAARSVMGFVTPSGMIQPLVAVPLPLNPDEEGAAQEASERRDLLEQAEGTYGQGANALVPYGGARAKLHQKTRELNATTKAAARFTPGRMLEPMQPPGLFGQIDPNDPRTRRQLMNPLDPRFSSSLGYYMLTEIGGIYGFAAVSGTGDLYANRPMLADAGRITSFERTYWDRWNTGGLLPTPALSEAFRRFLPHRFHSNSEYDPIRNTMPGWLPGLEGQDPAYFLDFLHGDPYTKVPNGEARLPGAAYEQLHGLAPSPRGMPGANYDDLTKLAILADVAPWSQQYKYYRDYLTHSQELTPEQRDRLQEIKHQVSERKHRFVMHPYTLRYAQTQREEVHVKDVLDNSTFTTYEHPDTPVRLAGVRLHSDDQSTQWIRRYVHPGAALTIAVAADPTQRVTRDTLHTMRAAVYAGDLPLNRLAIDGDYGTETGETSPAALQVRYTAKERHQAALFEWLGHARIPLVHNKWLPIDSPLELYKRTQVYGKDWQDWRHPFKDYVYPSFESFAQQGWAGLGGAAFLGFSLGVGSLKNRLPIAAAAVGVAELVRLVRHDHPVPHYRERERDIDEYFDVLKYVKYEGLYEKTRTWISVHQHHDIGALADRYEREGEQRKRRIQVLKEEKRQILITGRGEQMHDRLLEIRHDLHDLQTYRQQIALTPEDALALQYRSMAKTTLYGADSHGNLSQAMLAMDPKEREFFQAFLKAPGAEREQILKVIPANERRFLEASWGMKPESKPTLSRYFQHHFLPGADWSGWRAESNLDDYKLVVMKDEGLNLTSHGFWPQDEARVSELGLWDVHPNRPSAGDLQTNLHAALSGAGLRDVDINLMPNGSAQHDLTMHVQRRHKKDRRAQQGSRML